MTDYRTEDGLVKVLQGKFFYWLDEDGKVISSEDANRNYLITSTECPNCNYYYWDFASEEWVCDEVCRLECAKNQKIANLKTARDASNEGKLLVQHNNGEGVGIYYIKANETTKKEASMKYVDIVGKTTHSTADLSWYADWDDEVEIPTKMTFSDITVVENFLTAIGSYFQETIQTYLNYKGQIMKCDTIEEVNAIDISSIVWADRQLGEFN